MPKAAFLNPSKQALLKHCSPFEHQILLQSIALSQGAGVSGFGQELSLYYQALLTLSAQLLQESSHMG